MKPNRRSAGFTLIETVIATVILAGVVYLVMQSLFTSSSAATTGGITSELEARGRNFVDHCKLEFMTARLRDPLNIQTLGIYQDNTEIRYQIPVVSDPQQYGYTAALGRDIAAHVDWAAYVRFEPAEILVEPNGSSTFTLPTASSPLPAYDTPEVVNVDWDLNKDGDETDAFLRGTMVLYPVRDDGTGTLIVNVTPADGPTEQILSDHVIVELGAGGDMDGDIDGDGNDDGNLIFRYVDATGTTIASPLPGILAKGIVVSVWHGNYDENGKGFILRQSSEGIRFRNIQ